MDMKPIFDNIAIVVLIVVGVNGLVNKNLKALGISIAGVPTVKIGNKHNFDKAIQSWNFYLI